MPRKKAPHKAGQRGYDSIYLIGVLMVGSCARTLRYPYVFHQVLDVLWWFRGYTGYHEGNTEVHDGANRTEGIR